MLFLALGCEGPAPNAFFRDAGADTGDEQLAFFGEPSLFDRVVEAPPTVNPSDEAERAVNGVRGAGQRAGSFDVYSLGFDRPFVTLGLSSERVLVDGPGDDFVVFENPFKVSPTYFFMDPLIVSVSHDGLSFVDFPHRYLFEVPTRYSADPQFWQGFAGLVPVTFNQADEGIHLLDAFGAAAGGDRFDLASLPAENLVAQQVWQQGVRFVRLTWAHTVTNPQTGSPYPADSASNGSDIDGVVGRYVL